MRIACIATSTVPSKTANSIQVMKMCQAYARLGHQVALWVPNTSGVFPWEHLAEHYGLAEPFEVHWVASPRWLRRYDFAARSVWAARRWRAVALHLWSLQAAALATHLGIPTLLELHDPPPGRAGPVLYRTYLRGRGRKRPLPITGALRDWLVSTYGFALDEPFALVAPMGVDLERYEGLPEPTEARVRLELPERLTVGYTGHLYAGRGVDLLFQLAGSFPEAQFVLAGGEPDAVRRWEARRQASGLQNVRLLGFIPNQELPMVQAACEILAMPYARRVLSSSGTETGRFASPMKTFEYLASGRAILSSDLPVLREVLSDENAVLVPSEDLSAWQGALKDLIRSPDRRSALAAQARLEAERYTWRSRARRVLEGFVD